MKQNHIPVSERLKNKIGNLKFRRDVAHVKSPTRGNPYWCCNECGVYDPELSIRRGKHYGNCSIQGLDKEIEYYENLLREIESKV